jgi:hypothetical protein
MMLVLALRTSPELVYQQALQLFSPGEIAEAFAATRGITVPSQLRAEIRKDGRDLVGACRRAVIKSSPQRWQSRLEPGWEGARPYVSACRINMVQPVA